MDAYALRFLLGAVFIAMAGYYGYLSVTEKAWPVRVSHLLNVLMCAAMVFMVTPWGHSLPAIVSMEIFTAAALWFAYLALFTPQHCHTPWFHALKMLAMVWMSVAMTLAPRAGSRMGHDMSAMGTAAPAAVAAPQWSLAVTAIVALVLLAGAIRTSTRFGADFAKAAPAQQLRVLADGSLALGMALALVVL